LDFLQSFSSGSFPHKLQGLPSLFKNGLFDAHVPENLPSFLKIILIEIPAKAIVKRIIDIKNSSMN
tara:strand:+ start:399 stop:596 length:198 start_codon:yes stop_codon:yes gene_type:complete